MQPTETTLLDLMRGLGPFTVPIYHRTYRWSAQQLTSFWNDIARVCEKESGTHFLGLLYTVKDPDQGVIVVDGMHRLVTATLLLVALRSASASDGADEVDPLLPASDAAALAGKFRLKGCDQQTLQRVMDGQPQTAECSPHIHVAYRFFLDLVGGLDQADRAAIYRGLTRLRILDVTLDPEHDDAQDIYLTVNT